MRQLPTLALTLAMVGLAALGNPGTVSADILVTVSSGSTTESYDIAGNAWGAAGFTDVGGYTFNVATVITNYPAENGSGGQISTTVNVLSSTGSPGTLSVQVQLVESNSNKANLLWTTPAVGPVSVSAASSFVAQPGVSSGTVTTNTYNSTSSATTTGIGQSTVSASDSVGAAVGPNYINTVNPAGSYTLSQTMTLSGLKVKANDLFSFAGTSAVTAPEPSSLAIASLGGLGLIGYGLRRRKARGA
jgi:hypothetical protein